MLLLLIFGIVQAPAANATLLWDWSFNFGGEAGQIETTGDVVDLASARNFTVTNMSLTNTSTNATLADVDSGTYLFSSTIGIAPSSIDWDGNQVTALHDQSDLFGAPGVIEIRDPTPALQTQIYLGFNFPTFTGGLTLADVATTSTIVSTATGASPLSITPATLPPPPVNPFVGPIALSGEIAPAGNGFFNNLGSVEPVISDNGRVAFANSLTGSAEGQDDDVGLFVFDGSNLRKVAREGEAIDAANEEFFIDFNQLSVNNENEVAFQPGIDAAFQGANQDTAVFQGDGLTDPIRIAIETEFEVGQDAATYNTFEHLTMNNGGQIAWLSDLDNAVGSGEGIYRSGGGSITRIARAQREGLPDGSDFKRGFGVPVINVTGHVAFRSDLQNTPGGTTDDSGIFRALNHTNQVLVVREGDTVPGGNGEYASFSNTALNHLNKVAFVADLRNTSGGSADDSALYQGNETTMIEVARKGDTSPDGNGTLESFSAPFQGGPAFNDAGQVAIRATLAGTNQGSDDDRSILLGDGTDLDLIAPEGNAAPGGGRFGNFFGDPLLNESGQVVFTNTIFGGGIDSSNDFGIYAVDPALGLLTIFREGDFVNLGGGDIRLIDAGGISFGSRGLNDDGFLAVGLAFTDGTSGIFRGRIAFVATPLPGDLTGDGFVDGDDFLVWQAGFGVNDNGDIDGDTDGDDFLLWQTNFTPANGAGSNWTAVPEPRSMALIALLFGWLFIGRGERFRRPERAVALFRQCGVELHGRFSLREKKHHSRSEWRPS